MKSKSGYQIKKSNSTKIAGSPSFQIRPADEDPQMSREEWEFQRKSWERFFGETPQGRVIRDRARKAGQKLPRV